MQGEFNTYLIQIWCWKLGDLSGRHIAVEELDEKKYSFQISFSITFVVSYYF